jgi:hypothetical protein
VCLIDRYASLDQSQLIFVDSLVGSAIGKIQYVGTSDAVNGSLSYFSIVSDSGNSTVINSNQTVLWTSPSSWSEAGTLSLQSKWSLQPKILSWDVNASLAYFDQQFAFIVEEKDYVGDSTTDAVVAFGNGTYAGSWSAWEAILTESYLYYNEDFVGSATGSIVGLTPNDWLDGDVRYQSVAKDSLMNKVFTTNGESKWLTATTWSEDGFMSVLSEVFIQDTINWNASGSLKYGDSLYSFYVLEEDLKLADSGNITTDDYLNASSTSVSNFYAFFDGGYNTAAWNNW